MKWRHLSRKRKLLNIFLIFVFCFIFMSGRDDLLTSSQIIRFCWDSNNQADFEDRSCVFRNVLVWERDEFPLRLNCDASNLRACESASEYIEQIVGCDLFVPEASRESADIILYNNIRYNSSNPIAATSIRRSELRNFRATIEIYLSFFVDNSLETTIVHELGHALGLEHDEEDKSSIMYPWLRHTPMTFTEEDTNLLRELYCR